jgi:hypothetical protein
VLGSALVPDRSLSEQSGGTLVARSALGAGEFRAEPTADDRMEGISVAGRCGGVGTVWATR